MPKNQSRAKFKDITHFRLLIATSTNRFQNGWCKRKRLGPGALFRAHRIPDPAFTYKCSPTVCRRKRSKLLFTNQRERFMGMEDAGRQLQELYAVLQRNLRLNSYLLQESAFNRVSVLLNYLTEYSWLADGTRTWQKINCNCIIILLGFCKGSLKFQIDFILPQCSPFALIQSLLFLFFDRAQLFLVVDVISYDVPCLESYVQRRKKT